MVEALNPASLPKKSARAGSKSLVDSPRRYSTGSTSVILGERRTSPWTASRLSGFNNQEGTPRFSSPPPSTTSGYISGGPVAEHELLSGVTGATTEYPSLRATELVPLPWVRPTQSGSEVRGEA